METENDIPPLRRTRYIITLVLPAVDLPNDPLSQKAFLEEKLDKIKAACGPEKVGIVVIMDDAVAEIPKMEDPSGRIS